MIDFLRHSESHIFLDELSDVVQIQGPKLHHLANVLRVKVGDTISAAHEGLVRGYVVSSVDDKNIELQSSSVVVEVNEKEVHLAVSIFKMDKLEWGITKAIETGARSITIGTTSRSSFSIDKKKKEKVQGRFNALALSACSQSRRAYLTEIKIVDSLVEYVQGLDMQVLICEPGEPNENKVNEVATFVIGPEGGFTEQELKVFSAFSKTIGLSPYILRAETAMAIAPTLATSS